MKEVRKEENGTRPSSGRVLLGQSRVVLPNLKAQLIFWSLLAFGVVADLWSKTAVFNWLQQKQFHSVSIIDGFLRLVLAQNNGAAFGLFSSRPYLLAVVSVIALIVIFVIFFSSGNQHTLVHIALAFLAAGVCGNLYDRIFNKGFVRDFIDVYCGQYHWPTFNIADTILCIGVGVLILSTFIAQKSSQKHAQPHK